MLETTLTKNNIYSVYLESPSLPFSSSCSSVSFGIWPLLALVAAATADNTLVEVGTRTAGGREEGEDLV